MPADLDALVVGGGPAGLTAGLYLGRFRRSVMVVDSDESRLGLIPITHNHPGFPDGVQGRVLLERIRLQAERYGAVLRSGRIEALAREDEVFVAETAGQPIRARNVILATGVEDRPPAPDFHVALGRGLIRLCPICDAFEVIGQNLGVGEHGAREATFLRRYSRKVTLLHVGRADELDDAMRGELATARINLIQMELADVVLGQDAVFVRDRLNGDRHRFDTVYSALGMDPRSQLAQSLDARTSESGSIVVDEHQRTTVDGLYAAGDVVRGLNQISVAQAEAAIAATDIHNRLRGEAGA